MFPQQALPGVRIADGVAKKTLSELRRTGAAVAMFPTLDKVMGSQQTTNQFLSEHC